MFSRLPMKGPAVLEKARLYPLWRLVVSTLVEDGLEAFLHSPEEPLEADDRDGHD
jgi:hypothetical protein